MSYLFRNVKYVFVKTVWIAVKAILGIAYTNESRSCEILTQGNKLKTGQGWH